MAVGESELFPPCRDPAGWASFVLIPAGVSRTGCPERGGGSPFFHRPKPVGDDSSGLRGFLWKRQIKKEGRGHAWLPTVDFFPSDVYCSLPIIKST